MYISMNNEHMNYREVVDLALDAMCEFLIANSVGMVSVESFHDFAKGVLSMCDQEFTEAFEKALADDMRNVGYALALFVPVTNDNDLEYDVFFPVIVLRAREMRDLRRGIE